MPSDAAVAGLDYEVFRDGTRTVYAATLCLEIIFEKHPRLPQGMKARYPSIAWKDMAGAGNVYRHNYEETLEPPVSVTRHKARSFHIRCV